jgi:hypothetical protein
MFLKREDPKKETSSRNRSPAPSNKCLAVVPLRHPARVSNQKDKGVAVPQIAHSPIHVAFQTPLCPGQLPPPIILIVDVCTKSVLNCCGGHVRKEVGFELQPMYPTNALFQCHHSSLCCPEAKGHTQWPLSILQSVGPNPLTRALTVTSFTPCSPSLWQRLAPLHKRVMESFVVGGCVGWGRRWTTISLYHYGVRQSATALGTQASVPWLAGQTSNLAR